MEVAYFTSISMLGSFLFSPLAGILSDYLKNRKYLISIFCFFDAALYIILTTLDSLSTFLFVRFLEGAAHIFVIGLLLASAADRENEPQENRFYGKGILMGIAGMFLSLGGAFGMPLGILGRSNPLLPFYVGAGILVLVGLCSLFFLRDKGIQKQKEFKMEHLWQSFREIPYLAIPFAFNFIDRFTVGFLVSSFNLYLRESVGLHPGTLGLFLGLVLFPMSFLSYPSSLLSRKTGILPLVLVGSFIYGTFLAMCGSTLDTTLLFSYLLLAGIGAGIMFVPSMLLAARLAKRAYTGTVMSAFTGMGSLGFMLGPIVSVQLQSSFESLQLSNPFFYLSVTFGALEILMVLVCLPFFKKVESKLGELDLERREIALANQSSPV